MAKNRIFDTSCVVEDMDLNKIRSIDIEGAPQAINQLSIVDGRLNSMFNGYFTKDEFSSKSRFAISKVLEKANGLVGFNISSDLKALNRYHFKISSHTLIIDLYRTFLFLVNHNVETDSGMKGYTLKDVAAHYDVHNKQGWHDSFVDSMVTMRLFFAMYKAHQGKLWVIGNNNLDINDLKKMDISPKTEKENPMESSNKSEVLGYSGESEAKVTKISRHLYQGIITVDGEEIPVRMTKAEYKLYKKICKVSPGYPLRVYYLSVLKPGAVHAMQKQKLQDKSTADESEPIELEYKGYKGSVSYSQEDKIYYGKVLDINDSVSFEGKSMKKLEKDFHCAIDDYLQTSKSSSEKQ